MDSCLIYGGISTMTLQIIQKRSIISGVWIDIKLGEICCIVGCLRTSGSLVHHILSSGWFSIADCSVGGTTLGSAYSLEHHGVRPACTDGCFVYAHGSTLLLPTVSLLSQSVLSFLIVQFWVICVSVC